MARKGYTEEQIEYLREISPGRYNDEITKMFNKKFNQNRTVSAINTIKSRNGIRSEVSETKTEYTKEHLDYLRELCKQGLFNKEITKKFNKKFNQNRTERAIKSIRGKYGITTSARNYWKKGHTPWNKGKTGYMGANRTSFKKGEKPPNTVKVGTEIIDGYGYAKIKIAEPNIWAFKHRLIWEKHNGEVPEGHCIIFGDGDKANLNIENLICVSRSQLVRLNQFNLIKDHADLTRVGVNIVDLHSKVSERERRIK